MTTAAFTYSSIVLSRRPQHIFLHKGRDNSTTTYKMAITPIITFKAGKIDLDVRLIVNVAQLHFANNFVPDGQQAIQVDTS